MLENKTEEQAKEEILAMVAEYCDKFKAKPPYKEGDRIPYASRVFDNKEMTNLLTRLLSFGLQPADIAISLKRTSANISALNMFHL